MTCNKALYTFYIWLLAASPALAIVGGNQDDGALSQGSVMVLSAKGAMCTGVVVTQRIVLTAAHCVSGDIRIHYRDMQGAPVLIVPRAKAVHPEFKANAIEQRTRSIDLALVQLPSALPASFKPLSLHFKTPLKNQTIIAGGYGVDRSGMPQSTGTFRTTSLQVVEPYGKSNILVWAQGNQKGVCQGDSGGPLTTTDFQVMAISSWATGTGKTGKGCGNYSQGILLEPQKEWIEKIMLQWQ